LGGGEAAAQKPCYSSPPPHAAQRRGEGQNYQFVNF